MTSPPMPPNDLPNDPPFDAALEPAQDKARLRRQLQAERQTLVDRPLRAMHLQEVLRVWLMERSATVIGAYWPIKGEFDALPALFRWTEAYADRQIALPVMDKATKQLSYHQWYPGCDMEEDAYGIPKPKGTPRLQPHVLLVPCVGYGPRGVRLGYGGGFFDRTLAAMTEQPHTVGLAYANGFVPWLKAEPHDVPLMTILTDEGLAWQAP